MRLTPFLFVMSLIALGGAAQPAHDVPIKARFLRLEKGQTPLPPRVHLGIELENTAKEPRWLLLSLSPAIRLPKDGKFAADPASGLPFFALAAKDATNKGQAVMIGFLGEPRFSAFYLPAGAKVLLDDFEFPSVEDLTEMDWLEAKSLRVNDKTQLDKWLPAPMLSTPGIKLGKEASWVDVLRDRESGEPRADLPKEKVRSVVADVVRGGRLSVANFQASPRYYQLERANKADMPAGWNLLAGFAPVRPLKVEHLAFAPDGSWLAASLQTFKVVGLDLDKGKERVFPSGEKALARFFAFSPEGHLLVKQASDPRAEDTQLELADWTTGKVLDVLRFSSRITLGNIDHVPAPDGLRVAVAQKSSFNLWDFGKLETVKRFPWPASAAGFTYRTGVFSPDGKRFAAGLENPVDGGKAIVWDVATGEVIAEFAAKQTGLTFLALSNDGGLLAGTGKQASAVWVWSVDAKDERAVIREMGFSNIHALAFSPDGAMVAVAATPFGGGEMRGIELFGVVMRKRIGALPGLRQPVTALAFSRDGRRLAGGEQLGAVRVWEPR